ncbi:hypothetical protein K438DRAFT_1762183 [Mycena galopus ATCC 62051]|nr:hypothetical protein K438DRAFT_1762183 [Mycena galopus ATCC 62051]
MSGLDKFTSFVSIRAERAATISANAHRGKYIKKSTLAAAKSHMCSLTILGKGKTGRGPGDLVRMLSLSALCVPIWSADDSGVNAAKKGGFGFQFEPTVLYDGSVTDENLDEEGQYIYKALDKGKGEGQERRNLRQQECSCQRIVGIERAKIHVQLHHPLRGMLSECGVNERDRSGNDEVWTVRSVKSSNHHKPGRRGRDRIHDPTPGVAQWMEADAVPCIGYSNLKRLRYSRELCDSVDMHLHGNRNMSALNLMSNRIKEPTSRHLG